MEQSFNDIEIIVVDDGSTDNSVEIVRNIADGEARIKLLRHTRNEKLCMARKNAVMTASGEYIIFVDADDVLADGALARIFDLIQESNSDIIEFNATAVDPETNVVVKEKYCILTSGTLNGAKIFDHLLKNKIGQMVWNKAYRADLCKRAFGNVRINELYSREDVYFCAIAYTFAESYYGVDENLYIYSYYTGASRVKKMTLDYFKETLKSSEIIYSLINTFFDLNLLDDSHERYLINKIIFWISEVNFKHGLRSFLVTTMLDEALSLFIAAWLRVSDLNEISRTDEVLFKLSCAIIEQSFACIDELFSSKKNIWKNRQLNISIIQLAENPNFRSIIENTNIFSAVSKHNIDIWGSCVCREIFNYGDNTINILHYTNGCSPFSIVFPKCEKYSVDVDSITMRSRFERRAVCIDVNKSYCDFFEIGENNSDILIIDINDMRLDLAKISRADSLRDYIVTYGTTFAENYKHDYLNGVFRECTIQIIKPLNLLENEINWLMEQYISFVQENFQYKKIIVVETYCALKYYDDNDGLYHDFNNGNYLKTLNSIYKIFYNLIAEKLPDCHFVRYDGEFVGYKQHHLGLFPLHFSEDIYRNLFEQINEIIVEEV